MLPLELCQCIAQDMVCLHKMSLKPTKFSTVYKFLYAFSIVGRMKIIEVFTT